jgi:hypothetical protein
MNKRSVGAGLVAAGLMLGPLAAVQADTLTFDYGTEVTGGDDPSGTAPWLTATFDDGGAAGSVDLELEANLQAETEFFSKVLFNLDPALNNLLGPPAPELSITPQNPQADVVTPNVGLDGNSGGGGFLFDIELAFPTSNNSDRFENGDVAEFLFEGPDLVAGSFDTPASHNSPNQEGYLSMAHAQGIPINGEGSGGSGWIVPGNGNGNPGNGNGDHEVPVPAPLALMAAGLLIPGLASRRALPRLWS